DGQIAGEVTPKQREYSLKLIRRFAAKDKAEKRARQEEKAAKQSGINPGA
ncbi:hypothetical protein SLZ52_005164, partial [Escherichia coli]|nr:hypothetical protein [Escherichia coli]